MDAQIWDRITRREPMISEGKSGSELERGWLDDGTPVVIKKALADADWIMQATRDDGRVADIWAQGVFDRVPATIEHAMLAVRRTPGGAELLMSDQGRWLFSQGPELRAHHLDLLEATAALHHAFASGSVSGLCDLRDYYSFLSPDVCARYAARHEVPRLALQGWARFHELVPEEVAGAVGRLHADPEPLVAALLEHDATLVHGDLKMANLGVNGDRVVVLDWGTLTAWAPAAVDYAWYMAINGAALELDQSVLLEQCRQVLGPDDRALDLALLGVLAQLGWEKALGASVDDPTVRDREQVGLAWWVGRARETLAKWPL